MCKPHKHQAEKDTLGAQTSQERRARLSETELRTTDAKIPDFSSMRNVWEGLPCPEGEHDWGPSDLEGSWLVRCRLCGADGEA
jgi:hypothetical protein